MPSSDDKPSDKPLRRSSSRGSKYAKLPGEDTSGSPARVDRTGSVGATMQSGAPSALDQFRAPPKRLSIHPLELALLSVVAAHLVFLPWALGTVRVWAQWISLGFATVSFGLALLPRNYTAEHTGAASFRLIPLPKLLKFPIFWLGLALLALVTIQGLNPAWEYTSNGKIWWMHRISHVSWLPSGVRVPFVQPSGLAQGGPWRNLLIYSSAWMTVCAIWVGFTRRRTVQRFFLVIAGSGLALAIFGLAQRILGADKIYWFVPSPNASFFSTFIYKNHAGAYLNLTLAVACALGAWFYMRGVRRLEKSNPSGVFAFLVTCIAVSILVSYARGATLTMLGYLCVIVAAFIYHQWRLPKEARSPAIAVALLLVFGFFLKTGLSALHSELAWDRLKQAVSGEDVSVHARQVANSASLDMLREHAVGGVGSGGFGFLFPPYQRRYPDIAANQFWQHAHNDVLQFPIELGAIGTLIIVAAFAWWTIALIRNYAWQNPLSASVIIGCVFLIGMAWGDFVFQCPAVLITWCALWPACTLWAQLEEQRGRA